MLYDPPKGEESEGVRGLKALGVRDLHYRYTITINIPCTTITINIPPLQDVLPRMLRRLRQQGRRQMTSQKQMFSRLFELLGPKLCVQLDHVLGHILY